jgi:long-chain acyl-CoA synthetase
VRLDDLLFDEGEPGDPLVHAGDVSLTRAEVGERATAVACTLADLGVTAGAPVGVMLPDGADVIAALFGVWRAGGAYVPLNPRLGADDLAHVVDAVEPAAIVATTDHTDRFRGRPVLVMEDAARPRVVPATVPDRRLDPDVALIQFTSGTTGRPKPVMLLHSGVVELLDNVLAKLRSGSSQAGSGRSQGTRPPMPNLVPVSLSLWAGIYNVLFALRVGAPVVLMEGGFAPRELARLVKKFEIRSTVLPPAAMTALADDPAIDDLAPLRFVRSITAPLSPLQARRFRDRFGISILNSYGQTEIGGEIIGWNAEDSRQHGEAKLGSVGRPPQGVAPQLRRRKRSERSREEQHSPGQN